MEKSIILQNLNSPDEVKNLVTYLKDAFRDIDPIYSTTAPNGVISASRGKLCLYNNSGVYEQWQNVDGGTTWQRVDYGAILPVSIANGGTGQITAQLALNALAGAVTAARVLRGNGTNIVLAQIVLTTDVSGILPVANGGTNADTATNARASLGLAIGSDVQAYSSLAAKIKTGNYTGDGNTTKGITGVGFQPKFLIIYPQVTQVNMPFMKSSQDGTKTSYNTGSNTFYEDDYIISLDADGFTVGDGTGGSSANHCNINGRVYTYIAF